VSSFAAMVFLVGGWLIGAAGQPPGYDPVHETISALARHGAAPRWVMTVGLAGLGAAHIVTACGLAALRPASRVVLAAGGVATLGVSVFAQPPHGSSAVHIALATIGFVLLAVWPATTATRDGRAPAARDGRAPAAIRPTTAVLATVGSIGLLAWVGATQRSGPLGLSERLLTFEQAFWPFVVVVALRYRRTGTITT
jgi:hypothetical membrane protein